MPNDRPPGASGAARATAAALGRRIYPIYLGEFAANGKADMQSRADFTRLIRDQAEARGFSWSYWELASGFGVYDPVAQAWRVPLKDALLGH